MDRAALDAAYNNSAAVSDSAQIVAGWEARSARLRAAHPEGIDLRYGPDERNRIDYFAARRDGPVLAFIHGGYWQNRSKEVFSFVAEGPLAWGINVALVGYTLAPQKRLDDIVAEIRLALDWLYRSIPMLGGDPNKLLVSGWSAGGHLTAMAMAHPAVKSGLAISGIFDLEPMRLSYINDKLRLDEAEARRNSPGPTDKRLLIAYGADELPELRRQSEDYAKLLNTKATSVPRRNHFTVLEELAAAHGVLTNGVRTLFAKKGPGPL
jgi:acetyl esterase/lipase